MSVAYRANTDFATKLAVAATISGTDHETAEPADDHRFEATLDATGLPDALDVHVLAPIEREVATPTGVELESIGPLRALVDAPDVTGAGPTLELRGAYLIGRSEEHTSELQSLMRISYAVLCLKKKRITQAK